ncbi:YodC family protein [Pseudomonas monteilii]|uniref:YodC family protein n=1 Tax=Pseudomonas monteilii TaxID=76759 RepID=UPI003F6DD698
MRDHKLEVGFIVKLKSGGPDMTVRDVGREYQSGQLSGWVDCQWFAGKKLEVGKFRVESLVLVAAEEQEN